MWGGGGLGDGKGIVRGLGMLRGLLETLGMVSGWDGKGGCLGPLGWSGG